MAENQVFNLHGDWYVIYKNKTTGPWSEKGPAEACLSLLKQGKGEIKEGVIKWNI